MKYYVIYDTYSSVRGNWETQTQHRPTIEEAKTLIKALKLCHKCANITGPLVQNTKEAPKKGTPVTLSDLWVRKTKKGKFRMQKHNERGVLTEGPALGPKAFTEKYGVQPYWPHREDL